MKRLIFAAPVLLATLGLTEREAHALPGLDVEAGLKGGFATNPSDGPSAFGVGAGLRGGVSIAEKYYVGVSGIHYFGSSDTVAGIESSVSTTFVGAELGYTIKAIPLLRIRPQLGAGIGRFHYSIDGVPAGTPATFSVPDHRDEFYLEPGVTVVIPLGVFFVGADANALVLPAASGGPYVSVTMHGQLGVTF